ncbi:MAG: ATP-binding protein, partial [Pseudomonadota bacterium]
FSKLKKFLAEKFIPRILEGGKGAIPGAAVCGPNGSGKTFLFEAIAGMLGIVVLVIKNIRSKWFGDTDLKTERLERILHALGRSMIFIDEADVMLGGVGEDVHETERRLTGKIQSMMSDPRLLGKTTWLLMTARIHQLSPDLRRPGRAGSLIIPVLDPDGADRLEFVRWMAKPVLDRELTPEQEKKLGEATNGFYAALFTDVRRGLISESELLGKKLSFEEALAVISDYIPPAIELNREYQTLQALINCTRRSLLPDPNINEQKRQEWSMRIAALEARSTRGTR